MYLLLAVVLQIVPIPIPTKETKDPPTQVIVPQQTNDASNIWIPIITGVLGGIGGLAGALGTVWSKLRAQRYAFEGEIAKLQQAKEERTMHREDEAYLELKELLKERKTAADDLGKRIDKLEAEHKLCEEKYDKAMEQMLDDKVALKLLEAELSRLKGEIPPKV